MKASKFDKSPREFSGLRPNHRDNVVKPGNLQDPMNLDATSSGNEAIFKPGHELFCKYLIIKDMFTSFKHISGFNQSVCKLYRQSLLECF